MAYNYDDPFTKTPLTRALFCSEKEPIKTLMFLKVRHPFNFGKSVEFFFSLMINHDQR